MKRGFELEFFKMHKISLEKRCCTSHLDHTLTGTKMIQNGMAHFSG